MKTTQRILSILICVVMLIGLLPTFAITTAAGDTTYVLAGSDFQPTDSQNTTGVNLVNEILDKVDDKYTTMDGFLFAGDYDYNYAASTSGKNALQGAVRAVYGNNMDEVYVEGNHDDPDHGDNPDLVENGTLSPSGNNDPESGNYGVFVINHRDYMWYNNDEAKIQQTAANLKTYLDDKIEESYTKPIFVMSHLPLHYCMRTLADGDGKYANYIFDVLNDAGAAGLNIIFLFGHNHSHGWDDYLGGAAIFLKKGDSINIAQKNTTAYSVETLNFTYMNAGYVSYYRNVNSGAETDLSMTVFAITDTDVTIERYTADGLHDLKSAGVTNKHAADGSSVDGSCHSSHGVEPYGPDISVVPSSYTLKLKSSSTSTPSGATIGEWVEQNNAAEDDVTTSGNDWMTITKPVAGTNAYTYTLDTDGVNAREKYLIVNSSSNGTRYALTNNNGSAGRTTVTVSNRVITVANDTNIAWVFSSSNSGTVGNQNRYINPGDGSLSLDTNGTNMTISDPGDGEYRIYRTDSSNRRYYVRYSSDRWTGIRVGSNSSSAYSVYLYRLTGEPTSAVEGLYGRLEGNLTYEVASGTSAEDALAAVKNGIAIKYATAADYSDEAEFADDGEGMTWTLDPSYDGKTVGDYAVTISYNGTVIGTAEVVVKPAGTKYYIAEGDGLYIVDMNTSEADALKAVMDDVTVSVADDATGKNKTAVEDSDVKWEWVGEYNGTEVGPHKVNITYNGTSLGTVEVKVDVQYDTGLKVGWVDAGNAPSTYTYTLDKDGIDYGADNKYLIVGYYSDSTEDDFALTANGSNTSIAAVTISGETATVNTRDYEWYFARDLVDTNSSIYRTFITQDGKTWLYHTDSTMYVGNGSNAHRGYWGVNANNQNNGRYGFYDEDGNGNNRANWYLRYSSSGSKFSVNNTTSEKVRLYKYNGEIGGEKVYAMIEGNTEYTVDTGTSASKALSEVKAGIIGYISSNSDGSDREELNDNDLTWEWINKYNGSVTGNYYVKISYNDVELGIVKVTVEPGFVDNYPEYPNEGAVKVNKTSTGVDFQSTGVSRVELSASGVPSHKGVDVIVMLDTSSSMEYYISTGTETSGGPNDQQRLAALKDSLTLMLKAFKAPGADGADQDIKVAVAEFNGYYSDEDSPYYLDKSDIMIDTTARNHTIDGADSNNLVHTGTRRLDYSAFVDVQTLADNEFDSIQVDSGTNYDYAFDAIYQLAAAARAESGEERDLAVIFMSDGAPCQYNYFSYQTDEDGQRYVLNGNNNGRGYTLWNYWINGQLDELAASENKEISYYLESGHKSYYNYDGKHWMAEAIMGDPAQSYPVIRKNDATDADGDNFVEVDGLGATMYSIAFGVQNDKDVMAENMEAVIKSVSSGDGYYYRADTADELSNAFTQIAEDIAYAATNARFVDTLGSQYELQLGKVPYTTQENGAQEIIPTIEVRSYTIWTRAEYLDGLCSLNQIGERKTNSDGSYIYTVVEEISFDDDGTEAYSLYDRDADGSLTDETKSGNILIDGVICASTFWYNTNATPVLVDFDGDGAADDTLDADGDGAADDMLASETFYWKIGTIETSEIALNYYVYLTDSMTQGVGIDAGSYATNESAVLYYTNYLGTENCIKVTTSPVMPWKSANLSYAFYLVNDNGVPVNREGTPISFANRVWVTQPVVYDEIRLNNTENIQVIDVSSETVLPDGYDLFDENAKYTININSGVGSSWKIEGETKTEDGVDYSTSTYVTGFAGSANSNKAEEDNSAYDYTHTTVWFAVRWVPKTINDTIVVDYGLPVDIDVLRNDMFGDTGRLVGVTNEIITNNDLVAGDTTNDITAIEADGKFGKVKTNVHPTNNLASTVTYTPNTMLNSVDEFSYSVNYKNSFYYGQITVLPATTVYYDDNFTSIEYKGSAEWNNVDNSVSNQDEDRPGDYNLSAFDANNIYGYDNAYRHCATYSLNGVRKATVSAGKSARAQFTFYGTGFDVMSVTNNYTGAIFVRVYKGTDTTEMVGDYVVDTYYGYTKNDDGEWITSPNSPDTIYQVPVMKVSDLEYGQYFVTITATYAELFDHDSDGKYDFYFDGVRIYDPAGDTYDETDAEGNVTQGNIHDTIQKAYKEDGEAYPTFTELRDHIIEEGSYIFNDDGTISTEAEDTTEKLGGPIFIDSNDSTISIEDYKAVGPNNEVYLNAGQSIAFKLDLSYADKEETRVEIGPDGDEVEETYTVSTVADVQLGLKVANGENATVKLYNANSQTVDEAQEFTEDSKAELYYSIKSLANGVIVISNTGASGMIAITNIKITHTEKPGAEQAEVYIDAGGARRALMSLRNISVEDEVVEEETTTTPETTVPEDTKTETTVPETNTPEVETPEVNVPETDAPETTVPEDTAKDETVTVPEDTKDTAATPEVNVPATSVPENGTDEAVDATKPEAGNTVTTVPEDKTETETDDVKDSDTTSADREMVVLPEEEEDGGNFVTAIIDFFNDLFAMIANFFAGWLN